MRTTKLDRWQMRLPLPFSKGVERGGLVFTGGQCDLDAAGVVRNSNDTLAQLRATVANGLDVLGDLAVPAASIVSVRSFVVGNDVGEAGLALRRALDEAGAVAASTSVVPLRAFYYEGMMAETEFLAAEATASAPRLHVLTGLQAPHAPLAEGGPEAGARAMEEMLLALDHELQASRASRAALLRLTVMWPEALSRAAFEAAQDLRREWFGAMGPVWTDLVLPVRMASLDAWLVLDGNVPPVRHAVTLPGSREPEAVVIGPMLVTSGMTSSGFGTDLLSQTGRAMDRLDQVLASAGFGRTDIAKMSTYYVGGATAAELHGNLTLRAQRFSKPGPASTGIPVPRLPRPGDQIAIEAIAIKETPP